MEKKGLLEIIARHRTVSDLDDILKKDRDYQAALTQQQEAFDRVDELALTKEQKGIIGEAITANNHTGAVYGAAAYRFGMEDGIRLRMELEETAHMAQ